MIGKLVTLLGVLIAIAFFSQTPVDQFGALLGAVIRSIFVFLGSILDAATAPSEVNPVG